MAKREEGRKEDGYGESRVQAGREEAEKEGWDGQAGEWAGGYTVHGRCLGKVKTGHLSLVFSVARD